MTTDTGTDNRRHGFFIIDNEVLDHYDLNPLEGWLYIAIVRHINQQSGIAFPSLKTLAKECRMSKPTVIKSLQGLKDKKLITIEQQKSDKPGEYKPNHYTLIGVVKEIYHPSKADLPGVVKEVDSNNTKSKKTIEQELIAQAQAEKPKTKPKRKRKTKVTIPAERMNPMKDAIVAVFGWNFDTMNDSEKGQVQRAAKLLCQSDVIPDQVASLHRYCASQFTQFKPGALSSNVQEWTKWLVGRNGNASKPVTEPTADMQTRAALLPGRDA